MRRKMLTPYFSRSRRRLSLVPQIFSKQADELRVYANDKEKIFEDEATIGDQEVQNGEVIYVTFRTGENTFEDVKVAAAGGDGEGEKM